MEKNKAEALENITMTDAVANILIKLPNEENLTEDHLRNELSYREFNTLISGFGLKLGRNRTKNDMIEIIYEYLKDLWPEIHQIASLHKPNKSSEDGSERTGKSSSKPSRDKDQNKQKSTEEMLILEKDRTPFDPRLATTVKDMFLSPESNWDDVLMMVPPEEATDYKKAFKKVVPPNELIPIRQNENRTFLLQYCNGPTRGTTFSLTQLEDVSSRVNDIIIQTSIFK